MKQVFHMVNRSRANNINEVQRSLRIIEESKLANGMWAASTSADYSFTWIRDVVYIARAYINRSCNTYERAYHGMLDIFIRYEGKLDRLTREKPISERDYPHIRFNATTFEEVDTDWGHVQYDAYGAFLFGIGEGIRVGKSIIRNEKDLEIIQKLVSFLANVEYWNDPDSGAWEEHREIRSSSIAAVIAGLESVSDIVYVPSELISEGYKVLYGLFPNETATRNADLFQLTLIYPYNLLSKPMAQKIIANVEEKLLRENGGARYETDSYYPAVDKKYGRHQPAEFYRGKEAEWTFFFTFAALAHMTIGDYDKAKVYIERTESVMLEDGSLPELYYAGDYKDEHGNNYNGNTPLIWSNAMYVQAKEMYLTNRS